MRKLIFIGIHGCGSCNGMYEKTIVPLKAKYPDCVSDHWKWDETIARVNKRQEITMVPLLVVEDDGQEEFRCCGNLGMDELSAIIEYGEYSR